MYRTKEIDQGWKNRDMLPTNRIVGGCRHQHLSESLLVANMVKAQIWIITCKMCKNLRFLVFI